MTQQQVTYIPDSAVAERYHVSRATVWRWALSNRLPAPVKLSPGCTRWKLSELEAWESEQGATNG
jgi:predicted DNA-binding transcriptional regulator AlpA